MNIEKDRLRMTVFFVVFGYCYLLYYFVELFILLLIGLIIGSLFIFYHIRYRIYVKFLKNNSVTLEKLFELNKRYDFYHHLHDYKFTHVYDNRTHFDNISCEDYLTYQLQFNMHDIENLIKKISFNKEMNIKYSLELTDIIEFGIYRIKNKNLNQNYLLKIEKKLFSRYVLHPKIEIYFYVILYCSKINGRIYDFKETNFSVEWVISLIKRLNNKTNGFYNDKQIWDALCRVERGRVSNKVRFYIYQRDGYKCCKCGRGDDLVFLEIDHIKPISKGGKSNLSNLQTLCRECNKNKGTSYKY